MTVDVIVGLAYAGLFLAGGCAVYRVLVGPTLADRVIALDVALVSLMTGIAIDAAYRGDPAFLNLLVVIAVIGFTATVAITRFMEHHARDRGAR